MVSHFPGVNLCAGTGVLYFEMMSGSDGNSASLPLGRRPSTRSDKKEDKKDNETCGACKAVFRKKDKCLQCEMCELWYHASCENVSDAKFEILQDDNIHWYCTLSCNRVASKYLSNMAHIDAKIEIIADKVDKICEGEFPPKMAEALEKLMKQGNVRELEEESLKGAVRGEVKEAILREQRRLNLVVKGLQEDEQGDSGQMLDKMVGAMGLSAEWEGGWSRIRRAGKVGRTRPLIFTCRDSEQRWKILTYSKNLANTNDYKSVYVGRDLTRAEQGEQRELREKLKQKRELNDGKRYAIRKGAVVETPNAADDSVESTTESKNE